MRTTLDIDDDILAAAKERAAAQKTTAGKIISISALALMGIGYLWMKRIVRLDV